MFTNVKWMYSSLLTLTIDFFVLATLSAAHSADVSTLFDVGGIAGAIAAGIISDYSGMSATTCVGMLAVAAPMVSPTYTLRIYTLILICRRCSSINISLQ